MCLATSCVPIVMGNLFNVFKMKFALSETAKHGTSIKLYLGCRNGPGSFRCLKPCKAVGIEFVGFALMEVRGLLV